ncbi:MAG: fucose isomerase [Verrucomicrobia bacterium]|nr:MAG: fucose isomerase [Verrucomicrobiota bacterium]
MKTSSVKIGFIPTNRGFFDAKLASQMRREVIDVVGPMDMELVVPHEEQTKMGCVETIRDAEICADLFRKEDVDGILIAAVNFGSEQGVAWTIKKAGLDVPIMIFACQEEAALTLETKRRDAFCGLLSIADVLRQLGVKYSVAPCPIGFPREESFRDAMKWFVGVCRVVGKVKVARYGQIGARPDAFWTCRFDERKLQRLGPTTVTLDLSEVIAGVEKLSDGDRGVKATLSSIAEYADTSGVGKAAILKFAKLETFLVNWGAENAIDAFAIQCWTSIERNMGICPCTTMSRLAEMGIPAACEADILGALSMHALQLAGEQPAALADWNNLHNEDDDLVNLWHCGVFPKSFSKDQPELGIHSIFPAAGAATEEQSHGVVNLVAKASPATLTRVTQDGNGQWKALIVEGFFEENPACTAGSYGWCRIKNLPQLYRDTLLRHFPHHVAVSQVHVGNILWEVFGNYLELAVYHPGQGQSGVYEPELPFLNPSN